MVAAIGPSPEQSLHGPTSETPQDSGNGCGDVQIVDLLPFSSGKELSVDHLK